MTGKFKLTKQKTSIHSNAILSKSVHLEIPKTQLESTALCLTKIKTTLQITVLGRRVIENMFTSQIYY